MGLALAINLGLLLILLTLGIIPPPGRKIADSLTVDLIPESRSAAPATSETPVQQHETKSAEKPVVKPPPVILPVNPTITPPPQPEPKKQSWIEMSSSDMAAADISKLPRTGSGSSGDSEAVGHGPHGEVLYEAEWARRPTSAELGGYLPHDAPDGWGLIACRAIPENRVDDCVELDQSPHGSHLASAVRQAAWQFRVRPPRKNGKAMIGEWVRIRIDYEHIGGDELGR